MVDIIGIGAQAHIMTMRPVTLEGFCVKMLVSTGFGDFYPDNELEDPTMSAAEKRAILASWASDARAVPNIRRYGAASNAS